MGYKSLICPIEGYDGEIDRALKEIEDFSSLEGFSAEQVSKMRLIGEEVIGMAEGILQVENGRFYIEKKDNDYSVIFSCKTVVGERAKAIFDSTAKNTEYKGIAGLARKVFDAVESMVEVSGGMSSPIGIDDAIGGFSAHDNTGYEWSLKKYEESCQRDDKASMWDELELSVIKKMSKNVTVSYRNDKYEIEVVADI